MNVDKEDKRYYIKNRNIIVMIANNKIQSWNFLFILNFFLQYYEHAHASPNMMVGGNSHLLRWEIFSKL